MKILEIIDLVPVKTQEELADRLRDGGIPATQATVSRDIKELGLIKAPTGDGRFRYASSQEENQAGSERLLRIFRDCVLRIEHNDTLVVLHTMAATADAVCEAVDNLHLPEVIGTMAGERTVFVAVRNRESTTRVVASLHALT